MVTGGLEHGLLYVNGAPSYVFDYFVTVMNLSRLIPEWIQDPNHDQTWSDLNRDGIYSRQTVYNS